MDEPLTLPFDEFWGWLITHPNCILRAGTPEAVLYDDEVFHWQLTSEGPNTLVVQLLRGKRITGEILLDPDQVSYVQTYPGQVEGEFHFDLVMDSPVEPVVAYAFVMAHGWDETDESSPAMRVH